MRNSYLLAGLLSFLADPLASAQNLTETRYGVTSTSVYAQQQISLLAGPGPNDRFEATTSGFKAEIKVPADKGGRWSAPVRWTDYERGGLGTGITGMIGIHTHLLPNGNVFSWEGHNIDTKNALDASCTSHAYSWNPNPGAKDGAHVYPYVYDHYDLNNINIFCGGHTFLADGHLLSAGGHYSSGAVDRSVSAVNTSGNADYIPGAGNVDGYIGTRDLNIFDYRTLPNTPGNGWQKSAAGDVTPMSYRRWYPTATTLADGRVLVVAGQRYGGPLGSNTTVQAEIPEIYTPATNLPNNWQALTSAARRLPLYPWMFLAPDGRVFNAGPNPDGKFLDVNAGTWGTATYNSQLRLERIYGSAVMYAPGKVLILGGANSSGVTNTSELIDLTIPRSAAFRKGAPMVFARTHVNATILPDGSVLATGGTKANTNSDDDAVLYAELWTPSTSNDLGGSWTLMKEMSVPRLYHSTAVLLPDATVLTTGGGEGANFTPHPTYQIFTPPYLCNGRARPEISSAPQAVAYGQQFVVNTPNAIDVLQGGRATLVRLSSVTHSFNMNQRFLELTPINNQVANQVQLTAPNNPNECPPGHYMLFLLDQYGTPSHASIIAINTSACSTVLSIAQSNPNPEVYNACGRTTRFTVSGGPAGSTYEWTVNGTAYGTTGSASYIDLATSTSAPTAQVTVTLSGSAGCGASSTLTSYFPGCAP